MLQVQGVTRTPIIEPRLHPQSNSIMLAGLELSLTFKEEVA